MTEELEFLRSENLKLKARIANLEHLQAESVRKHSETYELNEVLQNRLRANGLSPYILPTEQELETASAPANVTYTKAVPLTSNMLKVLREVIDGTAVDHSRHITARERAGRGRTLDKLQERGLLDSAYLPTDDAKALVAQSAA